MTFGMGGTGTSDNAHEFIHRPFVWAYWLVGSLAAGRLFSILAARRPQVWTRSVVVSAITLTLVPVCYGFGLQHGKGSVGNVRSSIHVDRDLIDCARYIRNQAPADAVVQLAVALNPGTNVLDQVVVTGTVVATELKAVPSAITVIESNQRFHATINPTNSLKPSFAH